MQRSLFVLSLFYPVLIHLSILFEVSIFSVYGLAALLLLQMAASVLQSRGLQWLQAIQLLIFILCIGSILSGADYALYFPPIYISLVLFAVFLFSLRPGGEALISRFSRVVFNTSEPEIILYTRRVTIAWTVFFLLMMVEGMLLPLLVTQQTWSLFANILNYVFIVLFFLLEFIYRRLRFRQRQPLMMALRKIRSTDFRKLMG